MLEVKQKKEELEIAAPKVDFFDQAICTNGVASMGDVAKSFQVGRNKMFEKLRELKVLQNNNVPYQRFVKDGYFKVKETVSYNHLSYTTYVTVKGQTYLHNKLKKIGFIS